MWRALFLVFLLGAAAGGERGAVEGQVALTRGGRAVEASGVVVYLVGLEEPPPPTVPEIRQKGKRFVPELLAITAGQKVSFPNDDPVFHNVFSPSPAHSFDLGQYPRGDTKVKQFAKVGVIDVFCNIHPQMAATILVLPNRRFVRAAEDGRFRLDDLPPGHYTVYAYSRRAVEPASAPVDVVAGGAAQVTLSLDETRGDFAHPNKYGEKYRDPDKYRP